MFLLLFLIDYINVNIFSLPKIAIDYNGAFLNLKLLKISNQTIILNVLSFSLSNFTILFINTDTFPLLYRFCIFCRRATKIARRERDGRHLHRYLRICIRAAQRDLRLGGFKRFVRE